MPIRFARNLNFSSVELRRIERIIAEHEQELLEAWHDYFGH